MKNNYGLSAGLGMFFSWVFFVLLVFEINQPPERVVEFPPDVKVITAIQGGVFHAPLTVETKPGSLIWIYDCHIDLASCDGDAVGLTIIN